jgi:hypothetical protein
LTNLDKKGQRTKWVSKRHNSTPFCILVPPLDIVSRRWFKYPFTNRECTLCAVVCHKAQDPYWYSKITRHTNRSVVSLCWRIGEFVDPGWRSSMAEQLICNQQVVGSSPIASSEKKFFIPDAKMLVEQWWASDSCCLGDEERFPSGQREQTVNLPAMPSKVRILPSPPLFAGIAQLVEREPSKLGVAGSSPVSRSNLRMAAMVNSWVGQQSEFSAWLRTIIESAQVAQSVEHVLGKDEVGGSIPLLGFCPD